MAPRTDAIKKTKVILAEGADAYWFLRHALNAYNIEDVQVFDFGGIDQLRGYLEAFSLVDGYDELVSVLIARDAETNAMAAIDSIKSSLKNVGLPIPAQAYEFKVGAPNVAFVTFPGYDNVDGAKVLKTGTLEDLCLSTVTNPIFSEANKYIEEIDKNYTKINLKHKSTLHAYLAGNNDFVGMKIGEAAKAGAWMWASEVLSPLKNILMSM